MRAAFPADAESVSATVTLADLANEAAAGLGLVDPGGMPLPAEAEPVARAHGLLPVLPVRGPLGPAVLRAREETRARLVRAAADARLLVAAAESVSAPVMTVKGYPLARHVYPRADQRLFADIDVITTAARFGVLVDALAELGGRLLTRNWTALERMRRSEVTVLMPAGTLVDLHWHVVNDHGLRREFRIDTVGLLTDPDPAEAVPPFPAAVAHLGYVSWHMVLSGGTRLLWACDVELLARRLSGDGSLLRAWAARTGTAIPVGVALDFAAAAFPHGAAAQIATAVPDSSWRALNRRVKAVVLGKPAGRFSGAALPRACRSSSLRSIAALRPPVEFLWRAPSHRRAPADDVLLRSDPDPGARSRYLSRVGAGTF